MITWSSFLESSFPKILQILAVLAIFFGFYGIAFAAGARIQGKKQNILALSLFLVPAIITENRQNQAMACAWRFRNMIIPT